MISQAFNNIFSRQRRSPQLTALSLAAKTYHDSDSQSIEDFYAIVVQLADLSIESDKIFTDNTSADPVNIIRKALHLDADLVSWALSLNPTWRYKTIETPHVTNTNYHQPYSFYHGNKYHVYPNVDLASMWTNYHQTRIIIHGIIQAMCGQLLKSDPAHDCQHTLLQSIAISKQMVADICTSVPFYFISGETGIGGLLRLSWPLFIAADCAVTTPARKEWIRQTLEKIGEVAGIQQALTMSRFLKRGYIIPFVPGNAGRRGSQTGA